MIRVFVGHDPREAIAYDVFTHSVLTRASAPVMFCPLSLNTMRDHYREQHDDGSNQFIYSRFLVPYLCGFMGWAIFADGDMLCRDDIAKLWRMRDSSKAVQVVKHNYRTRATVKYLGAPNEDYPRKNWSSVILFNCGHPANQRLQPEVVMGSTGKYLHRFMWLQDELIGDLPLSWNWLVDEYDHNQYASLVHYTLGTPCFEAYRDCDFADEWYAELHEMLKVPAAAEKWVDYKPTKCKRGRSRV